MLTTSRDIPGSGEAGPMTPYGRMKHADPLGQLSQVPWDRLDRFQLSKVCKRLGIKHKAGEKKDVLLSVLNQRVEMGMLQPESILEQTRVVLVEEYRLKQQHADHREQSAEFIGDEGEEKPKETVITKEVIKTAEGVNVTEILELATANVDRLIEIAASKGIKVKKPDGRVKIVAEIQKAMGL